MSNIIPEIESITNLTNKKNLLCCLKELSFACNFEEVFLIVNKYKLNLDYRCLKILQNVILHTKFNTQKDENVNLYIYLADFLSLELFMQYEIERNEKSESKMQDKIIANFNKIFSQYSLIQKEFVLKNKYRIDILAKCKNTNRDVIIELKKHNINPNRQLNKYANYFLNPKLICISENDIKNKCNNIKYYIYQDLINLNNN